MPDEFQTAGAATLKPREAKVVRTRGADNRMHVYMSLHFAKQLVVDAILCHNMYLKSFWNNFVVVFCPFIGGRLTVND